MEINDNVVSLNGSLKVTVLALTQRLVRASSKSKSYGKIMPRSKNRNML
jgi:hypothetical protein